MVNLTSQRRTSPAQPGADSRWARALLEFILLTGALLALFQDALASMIQIWWSSSAYHHGFFVAPLSAWLVLRKGAWRSTPPAAEWRGGAIIALASLVWLFGRASGVALFGHAAVVIAIIGAAVLRFGGAWTGRSLFPLGFLFFMVPFGAEAVPLLQHAASIAVASALNFSGIETARDGFMLSTSAGRFEIAQSCAGLRFILAAAMVAAIVAHLSFRAWRTQLAFVGAALVVAVLANWLRAFLIVVIATMSERRLGVGPEHVIFGWIFYSALILALIVLARKFGDAGTADAAPAPLGASAKANSKGYAAIALSIAASAVIYDRAVVSAEFDIAPPPTLPAWNADGFAEVAEPGRWAPEAGGADARSQRRFAGADGAIDVAAIYFTRDREGAEIASVKVGAADGLAWRRTALRTERMEVAGRALRTPVETLQDAGGKKLEVAKIYWFEDRYYGSATSLRAAVALSRLRGRSSPGGAFFVAADFREGANPLLREFVRGAPSVAEWRQRIGAET